ncbi:hypothetical protein ACIGG6_02495 [Vreelandella lionensis]|uniref:Uncharacterized protein n=1 Tax=Vreelandella lionensis TaxID=1144478 RepID=A0ABW8BNR8_9GAMM
MFELSRRRFLQLLGALFASGVRVPALAMGREPYVQLGDVVSYIGPRGEGSNSFMGGQSVRAVHPWDGTGYPVDVDNNCFGSHRALERYYDFELSDFCRDVPAKFWHSEENRRLYNNVHTYVRAKRFGESIDEAVKALNFAGGAV